MARTTVDDCIKHCSNHFELVVGTVNRAKAIRRGLPSELPFENDREIVHALREISKQTHKIDLEDEILQEITADEELTSGSSLTAEAADESDQPKSAQSTPAND